MKKLTDIEINAIGVLHRHGPICPGTATGEAAEIVIATLNSLLRKRYAVVEQTDDGPKFDLSAVGRAEARK